MLASTINWSMNGFRKTGWVRPGEMGKDEGRKKWGRANGGEICFFILFFSARDLSFTTRQACESRTGESLLVNLQSTSIEQSSSLGDIYVSSYIL